MGGAELHSEGVEPVVAIILPDGRMLLPDRRRGDPLRRYEPPRLPTPAERRQRPRRNDQQARGRLVDLTV